MREVGTFEAKNKLSELLDLVEQGEEVLITRHGRHVARLVPPAGAGNRDAARAAATAIREMRKGASLGGVRIADLIGEGRR